MATERIQPRPYIRLLLLAGLVGFVGAVITFSFMWVVQEAAHLIWASTEDGSDVWRPIFTVVICAVAGIIVGVLVKVFGDHSGIFAELMQDFGRTGRFKYRQAPGMVVTAFVSLAAGGSLGPEAPMADACGSVATWTADRLKMDERSTRSLGFSGIGGMLGAFVTSPFSGALLGLESARAAISFPWVLFPSLVAAAVSTTTFVLLSGAFFGSLYVFPEYTPHLTDLLLAVPLGLMGAAAGAVFILLFRVLRKLMEPMRKHVILRGLLGGLGLGIAGAFFPLVLFSGEEQTHTLITDAATIGVRHADRARGVEVGGDEPPPDHGVEGRLHLPDDVRRRGPGVGHQPDLPQHPDGGGGGRHHGRGHGGYDEGSAVLGPVHGDARPAGSGSGDRHSGDRRSARDGAAVDGATSRGAPGRVERDRSRPLAWGMT